MHLSAFLYPTGYHFAAWRMPEVPAQMGTDFSVYTECALAAEAAAFDFLFLPDSLAMRGTDLERLSRSAHNYVAQFEPVTLLSALAAVTDRIGLVASASTTYAEPYHIARQFASLDHISGGRTGWNVVTSQNEYEAANFGRQFHPRHADRYRRAETAVDIVRDLWDSFEDDAVVADKAAGQFFDPEMVQAADHVSSGFAVRGPLNVPRSPQGQPVIVQAGASDAGRRLAARVGEVVFTAQNDIEAACSFRDEIHRRAIDCGRDPAGLRVLPGVVPILGETELAASAAEKRLRLAIDPDIAFGLLEAQLGEVNLSSIDPHAEVGDWYPLGPGNASRSRPELILDYARRNCLTWLELARSAAVSRGHLILVGTPDRVVSELARWHANGAADGFNVMPATLPQGLTEFCANCLPELRRRGLFRRGYSGTTLRDHLGLARPELRRRRLAL